MWDDDYRYSSSSSPPMFPLDQAEYLESLYWTTENHSLMRVGIGERNKIQHQFGLSKKGLRSWWMTRFVVSWYCRFWSVMRWFTDTSALLAMIERHKGGKMRNWKCWTTRCRMPTSLPFVPLRRREWDENHSMKLMRIMLNQSEVKVNQVHQSRNYQRWRHRKVELLYFRFRSQSFQSQLRQMIYFYQRTIHSSWFQRNCWTWMIIDFNLLKLQRASSSEWFKRVWKIWWTIHIDYAAFK